MPMLLSMFLCNSLDNFCVCLTTYSIHLWSSLVFSQIYMLWIMLFQCNVTIFHQNFVYSKLIPVLHAITLKQQVFFSQWSYFAFSIETRTILTTSDFIYDLTKYISFRCPHVFFISRLGGGGYQSSLTLTVSLNKCASFVICQMHSDKCILKWVVQRTSGFEIFCHTLGLVVHLRS